MPRPKRVGQPQPTATFGISKRRKDPQSMRSSRSTSQTSSERPAALRIDSDDLVTAKILGRKGRNVLAKPAHMSGAVATPDLDDHTLSQPECMGRQNHLRGTPDLFNDGQTLRQRQRVNLRRGMLTRDEASPGGMPQRGSLKPATEGGTSRSVFASQVDIVSLRGRTGSATLGSNLKTRKRKPSLLHALEAQQASAQVQVGDDENDSFDPNSFELGDDPTPLQHRLSSDTPLVPTPVHLSLSSSHKRKRGEPQVVQLQVTEIKQALVSSPLASTRQQENSHRMATDLVDNAAKSPSFHVTTLLPRPSIRSQTLTPTRSAHSPSATFSSGHSSTRFSPSKVQTSPIVHRPLTTARLQNLLPRRKIRKSPSTSGLFDLQSSDVESSIAPSSDADELSFQRAKSPRSRAIAAHGESSIAKHMRQEPGNRTYARVLQPCVRPSNLENSDSDENPNTSISPLNTHRAPKLRSPARKRLQTTARWFKEEVDSWALEVEDVSMHSQSSVMRDAR